MNQPVSSLSDQDALDWSKQYNTLDGIKIFFIFTVTRTDDLMTQKITPQHISKTPSEFFCTAEDHCCMSMKKKPHLHTMKCADITKQIMSKKRHNACWTQWDTNTHIMHYSSCVGRLWCVFTLSWSCQISSFLRGCGFSWSKGLHVEVSRQKQCQRLHYADH